jgi:hypothetical protein
MKFSSLNIFFVFSLFLVSSFAQAQFGLKSGVYNARHYRTYTISSNSINSGDTDAKFNYLIGLYFTKKISNKIEFQPEAVFLGSNLDHSYTFGVPLIFKYYIINNVNLQLGYQAYILSENPKYLRKDTRVVESNFGVPIGIEYKFRSGAFVNTRYLFGADVQRMEVVIGFNFRNKIR